MSRFLKYLIIPAICIGMMMCSSSCCLETRYDFMPLTLKFIILDKAGENVLLSNTLPTSLIWYYPENRKAEAVNPYPDESQGAFVMNVTSGYDYRIDIINQSFVQLDISYTTQKEQCESYETISGVTINGVGWDYSTNPILTFVYDP